MSSISASGGTDTGVVVGAVFGGLFIGIAAGIGLMLLIGKGRTATCYKKGIFFLSLITYPSLLCKRNICSQNGSE